MASREEKTNPVPVWFSNDLRLSNHAAPSAVVASGRTGVPVLAPVEPRGVREAAA